MKRIFLFIVTDLAVLALLSVAIFVIEQVFGVHLKRGAGRREFRADRAVPILPAAVV